MTADVLWSRLVNSLKSRLSATVFNTWFDDASAISFNNDCLIIKTSSGFKKDVIADKYLDVLTDELAKVFSRKITLRIIVDESEDSAQQHVTNKFLFNNDFTFSEYIVGNSNKFAHAAARAVADNPAESYNPLFIYGGSGLGKTHLLYAIAHEINVNRENYRIVYIKGDEFTNELVGSIQYNTTSEFREKYRRADLLLVDDIQFIAGKDRTQEEFFHTFNTLYESKKQIVLTADRPPREMARLEDRLRTRFESGLIADIQPPDFETRMAIIKNKAQHLGLDLSLNIVEYIAQKITSNVRQMEGTVKKLLAFRDLMFTPIDIDAADRAISDIYKESPGLNPTPSLIIEEVCAYYSVSEKDVRGQKRNSELTTPRHVAMYLIRQLTKLSLHDIGLEFEDRNHTTIRYSTEKIEKDMKFDAELANTVRNIQDNIRNR